MEMLNQKDELKRTKQAFILFMIGEICLLLAILSLGANFKFLPRWLESFAGFIILAFALSFIALCLIRKIHVSFTYSVITIGVAFCLIIVETICSTSNDSLYLNWAKGLSWTNDMLICLYHVYFLQGCLFIFRKYENPKMEKDVKRVAIIYLIIFVIYILFNIGTKIPAILTNTVSNRVFVYGTLLFNFASIVFIIVNTVRIGIKVSIIRKEEVDELREQQEAE